MSYIKGKWEVIHYGGEYRVIVSTTIKSNNVVTTIARCGSGWEDQTNARRICQCVNSHDDLLAACKVGLTYINALITKTPRPIMDLSSDKKQIDQAIAKAKEQQ